MGANRRLTVHYENAGGRRCLDKARKDRGIGGCVRRSLGFCSLPARGFLWARARRVSARLPSNFHLLAQMKVTKAKGLEHQPFDLFASATRLLPRLWHENVQRTTLSVTSLTFSRSSSFRLDPKGPRRGGVPQWARYGATVAAAKAQPVAAHPLESSVALPMGRTRQSACSRSKQAKWAGVGALCFGDFHLGQQMKVTRQPGRDPAGSRPENEPHGKRSPNPPFKRKRRPRR
jgi:hypothetical protein